MCYKQTHDKIEKLDNTPLSKIKTFNPKDLSKCEKVYTK